METKNIKLVPPSLDLVEEVQSAINESNAELYQFLSWVPASLNDPEGNMRVAIKNFYAHENELRFHILEKKTNSLIGTIALIVRDTDIPFYELGYWVRTSQAGKGYATEAVKTLENYAFQQLGVKRLEIRTAIDNIKSRAVAERCGYSKEGELKNERLLPSGKITSTIVYAKYG